MKLKVFSVVLDPQENEILLKIGEKEFGIKSLSGILRYLIRQCNKNHKVK